ncbi:MAG TPA: multidrug DMT transporter permease [Bryobacteraceae bacterium]|nr:multidrug DMT transporter permease [Bryobacteraceae bacterium]
MILPTTYAVALLLMMLSMLCWGSWANTFKLARNWRFELFYFDYAFGVLLAAVVAAFTLGSMGDGLSVMDNLSITGKRQMALALAGGVIFNLANMLLVAAISLSGLAVAFPVGIGLALVIGVIWNFILKPAGNPLLLFGGAALVVGAIVLDALAYKAHGSGKRTAGKFSVKGLVLSLVAGLLMGSFYPLVQMSSEGEIGLGPYTVALIFSVGVFASTLIFNLYFINLPVQGDSVPLSAYLRGTGKNHMLGVFGGVIWCVGAISNFVAASAPAEVTVGPAVSYALGQGATMVSALWGLLVWKEFAGASPKVRGLLLTMMVLFIGGLAMVSIAPLYDSAQR